MNISTLLKYLPELLAAGRSFPKVMQFIRDVKSDLEKKEERTSEEQKAFIALLDAEENDPAWKVE